MKKNINIVLVLVFLLSVSAAVFAGETEATGVKQAKVLAAPTDYGTGLAWDGVNLWLADRKDGVLLKINPADGSVVSKLTAPGYKPSGLAWDGSQLWISDLETLKIYRLDPKTNVVTRTIDSPVSRPFALAWDGKYLWVLDAAGDKSTISNIDTYDGTTIKSFPAPGTGGTGMTFDGKYLWISDRVRNEIHMVSPEYGNVINVIQSPGAYTYGLAWDGKYLWNADYQTDKLYALDVYGSGDHFVFDGKAEKVVFSTVVNNRSEGMVKIFDMYLAVPQDTLAQKLLGEIEWSPKPEDYLTDKWGQKVAHFRFENLAPGSTTEVEMTVKLKTYGLRYLMFPERIKGDIPKDILDKYLVDDVKFDIKNPYIQDLVKKIIGSETNYYWKVRKLYDYIIANMYYEMTGGWNTAPTVLKRGSGSCSEYSFSMIALCRAAGIPARYVGTLVIRGDDASWDDVYHRWNQVYFPGYGWVDVDCNRGDKPLPAEQGLGFGGIGNSFLLTTTGGGGSEYLSFNYNYDYKYTAEGRVNVRVDQVAEWEPIEETK